MHAALKTLAGIPVLAAALAAQAAAPTFDLVGATGAEYIGTAPMTQSGDDTVYWFLEQQNLAFSTLAGQVRVDSWLVFYNPGEGRQVFSGSIRFDQPIVALYTTQQQLAGSDAFGKPGTVYDYTPRYIGLERGDRDQTSFAAGTLTIGQWASGEPGDYVRVLTVTAVPEPATYALMLGGLLLLGCAGWRARR